MKSDAGQHITPMRVLITGAAGGLGSILAKGLKGKYRLRGFDRRRMPEVEESVIGDLANPRAVRKATSGMDAIIHLGGTPQSNAPWDEVLQSNIVGTYNVFESARQSGVRRIVYASRAGLLDPYPQESMRTVDMVPRPDSLYSLSKVFGEGLGYLYASKYGIEVVCVRIGNITPSGRWKERRPDTLGKFLSHRDAVHLFERCLAQPGIGYAVVFGVSNNSSCRYDLMHTREILDYHPVDRIQDFIEED